MFRNTLRRCRRGLSALFLATVCLGSPAGADPAVTPTAPASGLAWHKLPVQNASPSEVIRIMHWGGLAPASPFAGGEKLIDSPPAPVTLPEGVKRIFALESIGALLVEATPEGFARVQDIVNHLNVAPRRFQFKVQFVRARRADVNALGLFAPDDSLHQRAASGANVSASLQSLIASGSTVLETRVLNTAYGVPLPITYQEQLSSPPGSFRLINEPLGLVTGDEEGTILSHSVRITLIPRLLADDTILLTMDASGPGNKSRGEPGRLTQILGTARILHSGEMLVLGGLLTGKQNELLVFLTPTVLPEQTNPSNESGQKRGMMNIRPNAFVEP